MRQVAPAHVLRVYMEIDIHSPFDGIASEPTNEQGTLSPAVATPAQEPRQVALQEAYPSKGSQGGNLSWKVSWEVIILGLMVILFSDIDSRDQANRIFRE